MSTVKLTVLCVGATGSVGRHVVEEALRRGHAVRVLVRSRAKAAGLPAQAEIVVGELTQPDTLAQAVEGFDQRLQVAALHQVVAQAIKVGQGNFAQQNQGRVELGVLPQAA